MQLSIDRKVLKTLKKVGVDFASTNLSSPYLTIQNKAGYDAWVKYISMAVFFKSTNVKKREWWRQNRHLLFRVFLKLSDL